jgi:hypothetical protein
MKFYFKALPLFFSLFVMNACEKGEKETVFSKDGRKVSFDLTDRRGDFKDAGTIGIDGIDIRGYISNSMGGLHGNALFTCDRTGKYGYQVTMQPYGACDLEKAVLHETDTSSYYQSGETLSELSKNEIYYDLHVEAGTKRMIYISQGSFTDYEYEIRVRFIEE